MNGFLLDTNVISLLAPGREEVSPTFIDWISCEENADQIFVSAITIAEIKSGIAKLRRKGGTGRADLFDNWLNEFVAVFSNRILFVDAKVSMIAGDMKDAAVASGRDPGLADILIASTAKARDLTVVTHNIKHFEYLGVVFERPVDDAWRHIRKAQ